MIFYDITHFYNDGFLSVVETDRCGNLIDIKRYDLLRHGDGDAAESELQQVLSVIVREAAYKGKDVIYENLGFKKTKAKVGTNKKYNKMLHTFDYKRFKECLENAAHRNYVCARSVNPANTSKIGKQKFTDRMKLNIHTAAAFVITRRGMGIYDKLITS